MKKSKIENKKLIKSFYLIKEFYRLALKIVTKLRLEEREIVEIKNEVKILKELKSDYILRYYEDHEDSDYYLIFTEICVIINHKASDKRIY